MDISNYLPASIVQTAAGLLAVWSVLGLVTFFVEEWLSTRVSSRAKLLEATIRNMLADSDLTKRFFEHPLIQSLNVYHQKSNYISGKQFAEVLFHLILSDDFNPRGTSKKKGATTFEMLTQRLNEMKDKNPALITIIHAKLLGISDATNTHDDRFREAVDRVAEWYNEVMDRLNNAYINRRQFVSIIIALMLAVVLNADTIAIGYYFWRQSFVQQVVAAQPSVTTPEGTSPQKAPEEFGRQLLAFSMPLGWNLSNEPLSLGNWLSKVTGLLLSGVIAAIAAPFVRNLLYSKTSYVTESFFTPSPKKQED